MKLPFFFFFLCSPLVNKKILCVVYFALLKKILLPVTALIVNAVFQLED